MKVKTNEHDTLAPPTGCEHTSKSPCTMARDAAAAAAAASPPPPPFAAAALSAARPWSLIGIRNFKICVDRQ
jgi:hypothetical protein